MSKCIIYLFNYDLSVVLLQFYRTGWEGLITEVGPEEFSEDAARRVASTAGYTINHLMWLGTTNTFGSDEVVHMFTAKVCATATGNRNLNWYGVRNIVTMDPKKAYWCYDAENLQQNVRSCVTVLAANRELIVNDEMA